MAFQRSAFGRSTAGNDVVSLLKILQEHPVPEVGDNSGVFLPSTTKETRVGKLVQSACFTSTTLLSFPFIEKQIVASGLDHTSHHLLHVPNGQGCSRIKFQINDRTDTSLYLLDPLFCRLCNINICLASFCSEIIPRRKNLFN